MFTCRSAFKVKLRTDGQRGAEETETAEDAGAKEGSKEGFRIRSPFCDLLNLRVLSGFRTARTTNGPA